MVLVYNHLCWVVNSEECWWLLAVHNTGSAIHNIVYHHHTSTIQLRLGVDLAVCVNVWVWGGGAIAWIPLNLGFPYIMHNIHAIIEMYLGLHIFHSHEEFYSMLQNFVWYHSQDNVLCINPCILMRSDRSEHAFPPVYTTMSTHTS